MKYIPFFSHSIVQVGTFLNGFFMDKKNYEPFGFSNNILNSFCN